MKGFHDRLDYVEVIAHLLSDVKTSVAGSNTHELNLDLKRIKTRYRHEGISFFTKTMPALGKELDRVLSQDDTPINTIGWQKSPNCEYPRFLGTLFNGVLAPDGRVREDASVQCIQALRDILYLFYKYEIPHTPTQSNTVIDNFVETEEDIAVFNHSLRSLRDPVRHPHGSCRLQDDQFACWRRNRNGNSDEYTIKLVDSMVVEAAKLLSPLDLTSILPNHGPGVVSTGERGPKKYLFPRYSWDIERYYPYTEYFVPSIMDDAVDRERLDQLVTHKPSAKVILVPKDSRGPRLISCEPLENQWIQQGIKDKIVKLLETNRKTAGHVNFTNQDVNRSLALLGSVNGAYSTLDLKDASDRISLELVKMVFPEHVLGPILSCRTNTTRLPDGRVIAMAKFAPMGSALCFPILATIVWLCLTSPGEDACSSDTTYVYGDDIIVKRTDVPHAIKRLTSIGLLVNKSKSCTNGFFRESCGMDAYKGTCVTPFRLRKVWRRRPRPETIASYFAKANDAYNRGYRNLAYYFANLLSSGMGFIPYSITYPRNPKNEDLLGSLFLEFAPDPIAEDKSVPPSGVTKFTERGWVFKELRTKVDTFLQKRKALLLQVIPKKSRSALERENYFRALHLQARDNFHFFAVLPGRSNAFPIVREYEEEIPQNPLSIKERGIASVYTHNRASKLVRKWR